MPSSRKPDSAPIQRARAAPAAAKPGTVEKRVPERASPARVAAPTARTAGTAEQAAPHVAKATSDKASKPEAANRHDRKSTKVRPRLVRDSFTMPEADFALIAKLKTTALDSRRAVKKSELLRAGLRVLAGLDSKSLVAVLDKLEPVKTGRPKAGH